MALVRWLKKNNAAGTYDYYGAGRGPAGQYYFFYWDPENVRCRDEWKNSASKRLAIADIHTPTGQNAFHCIFSTKLPRPVLRSVDYYISTADRFAQDVLEASGGVWYAHEGDTRLQARKTQHNQLRPKLKNSNENYPEKIMTGLLNLFLEHFENDDAALMEAFLHPDTQGNTPLCYYFQMRSTDINGQILDKRLQKLSLENRRALHFAPNRGGKTLLHFYIWDDSTPHLNWFKNMLDSDSIKEALCKKDNNNNTPLHDLFLLRKTITMAFFDEIYAAITAKSSAEEKQNKPSVTWDFLPENNDLANPLHYLCKRAPCDENLAMLQKMLLIADKSKVKKIMQKDRDGFTPMHYAIQSGNFKLADEMLKQLTFPEKITLITMKHNDKQETLLHFICQHGNRDLLNQAVAILGPLELRNMHRTLPLKANSSNPHLTQQMLDDTIKKFSRLFDVFDYFVETYKASTLADGVFQSTDWKYRFVDFCDCLAALQTNEKLPDPKPEFLKKKHGFSVFGYDVGYTGSEKYHELRALLDNDSVTQEERVVFMAFLSSVSTTSDKKVSSKANLVGRLIMNRLKVCKDEPLVLPPLEQKPQPAAVATGLLPKQPAVAESSVSGQASSPLVAASPADPESADSEKTEMVAVHVSRPGGPH
ncbi:MAG TPA: hypothetical protein VLJ15_06805 [Gammaproteobacteria bacterium]|nr:hypothetical protein [Gammaproteobacteria bacterium]